MSPDIAMYSNEECPSKHKCYRFMAIPSYHQCYSEFKPKGDKCDDFVEMRDEKTKKD